jgi:hypothetical protein
VGLEERADNYISFTKPVSSIRDFSHETLFAGEDIHKKIVRSKVELKNTGLGQNKKYFGGEENPAFPGKLALGKKPWQPYRVFQYIGGWTLHSRLEHFNDKQQNCSQIIPFSYPIRRLLLTDMYHHCMNNTSDVRTI